MAQKTETQQVIEDIEEIGTCMFTTVDAEGRLASRPMVLKRVDEEHRLWFLTRADSEKVDDIIGAGEVNCAFVAENTWISVAGRAVVSQNEELKAELWKLDAKAYFAEGPDDPAAALIQVTPETAQYWESPGKAATLVQLAVSAVRRESPDLGDQGRVHL